MTKPTLLPLWVRGAKEKCLQCHELHVETDTEEGALNSAQMHRGDSVLGWGVILQGEEEDTHRYRSREQGSRWGK